MWILYFNGAPCFWLNSGQTYRVGRRDCDVIIKEDPSISRIHLSFEIGLSSSQPIAKGDLPHRTAGSSTRDTNEADGAEACANLNTQDRLYGGTPASITFIDSSTYGSTVIALVDEADLDRSKESGNAIFLSRAQGFGALGLVEQNHTRVDAHRRASSMSVRCWEKPLESADVTLIQAGEEHRMPKGTPFHVPVSQYKWQQFAVVLGNHGAKLVFVWKDLYALVENVEHSQITKLEKQLNCCGVQLLSLSSPGNCPTDTLQKADFFVSSCFEPTTSALVMLCRMTPIVSPCFFDAIVSRPTPQMPLPDPSSHLPPISPVWQRFTPQTKTSMFRTEKHSTFTITSEILKPNTKRRDLFAGITFVVLRKILLSQIRPFVECAKGHVILDDTLEEIEGRDMSRVVSLFARRHKHHIIVLQRTGEDVGAGCIETFGYQNGLPCISYEELVFHLLLAEPLPVTLLQTTSLNSSEAVLQKEPEETTKISVPSSRTSLDARKTDASPIFPSFNSLQSRPHREQECISTTLSSTCGRYVDKDGWITYHGADNSPEADSKLYSITPSIKDPEVLPTPGRVAFRMRTGHDISKAAGTNEAAHEYDYHTLELPPYPCFQTCKTKNILRTRTSLQILSGKRFSKQYLKTANFTLGELDMSFLASSEADSSTSQARILNTADSLPVRRTTNSLVSGDISTQHFASHSNSEPSSLPGAATLLECFNAFDTAAHNSMNQGKNALIKKRVQPKRNRSTALNTEANTRLARDSRPSESCSVSLAASHLAYIADPSYNSLNIFDTNEIF